MDHFIGQIEIENFRCFDFLKVENLRRVNLVGGDNNVGKSAFLEALEIVAKTTDPSSLATALTDSFYRRRPEIISKTITPLYLLTALMGSIIRSNSRFSEFDFDLISYEQSILQFKTDIKTIKLRLRPDDQSSLPKLAIESDKESKFDGLSAEIIMKDILPLKKVVKFSEIFNRQDLLPNIENTNFIPTASLDERELSVIYGKIVDMGMTEDINVFLRNFDSRIDSLLIRPTEQYSIFKIKLRDRKLPVLLSSMGGGLNRYIAIVCAIWKSKDGQLFIDEVENGIHYTKYEKLWEIIFNTSKEANCQVFAATHSKECIEAFSRVAERHDHENITYINLSRMVDNADKIVAAVLNSVGLEYHFQLGLDVR